MTRAYAADIIATAVLLSIPVALVAAVAHGPRTGAAILAGALVASLVAWGVRGR